jgi:hypothetical protein
MQEIYNLYRSRGYSHDEAAAQVRDTMPPTGAAMADPPIHIVSEQSEADIEKNRTREALGFALRAMAANLLRIIRGAGKSYELPRDMAECVRLFQAYYDAHAMWPDSFTFQQALDFDTEDRDRLSKNMTESDWEEWHIARAEYDICRASLQLVASRLIHQPVQERRGHR